MRLLQSSAFIVATVVLAVAAFAPVSAARSSDSFSITKYDVEQRLGVDGDKRSTLKTVETITADFGSGGRSHGLEKIFVKRYDGHDTDFHLDGVTDLSGKHLKYHWEDDVLRIGDEDTYPKGLQTYRITYSQKDVTKHYENTGNDEFYWDVIGDEWRVPITLATVRLTVAPELRGVIKTDLQCYHGSKGANTRCAVKENDGVYTLAVYGVGNGKGVTTALGFEAGTFAAHTLSLKELLVIYIGVSNFIIGPVAALLFIIWICLKVRRVNRRHLHEVGETVVPQYLPPKDYSVIESGVVLGGAARTKFVSAQLIDWAVRHFAEIRETKQKTLLNTAQYTIVWKRSADTLSNTEQRMATALYAHLPTPDETLTTERLKKRSSTIVNYVSEIRKDVIASSLYEDVPAFQRWVKRLGITTLILAVVLFNILILGVCIVLFIMKSRRFLSRDGWQLKQYLEGLKLYIKVAETERLKMLQSPSGSEKVGDVTGDTGARIKLYERVLPYAMLFGQEAEWSKQLGLLYAQADTSPDWMASNGTFNAVVFSSIVAGVSSSVTSASSYSSSSGGSGGGGSVGGGGGGGGGGGW